MITPVVIAWLVWALIMMLADWKWESIWQPAPFILMLTATVIFSLVGGISDGLVGLLVPWGAYISALLYFRGR